MENETQSQEKVAEKTQEQTAKPGKKSWLEKLPSIEAATAKLRAAVESQPEDLRSGFAAVIGAAFIKRGSNAFEGVAAAISEGTPDEELTQRVGLAVRYRELAVQAEKIGREFYPVSREGKIEAELEAKYTAEIEKRRAEVLGRSIAVREQMAAAPTPPTA